MDDLTDVRVAIDAKDRKALGDALSKVENRSMLVPLLISIVPQEWHESHEDIVFELGLIGDDRATEAISRVARATFPYLVRWQNLHEFQRKCAFALARIGTEESRTALETLRDDPDVHLSKYGLEALGHWRRRT